MYSGIIFWMGGSVEQVGCHLYGDNVCMIGNRLVGGYCRLDVVVVCIGWMQYVWGYYRVDGRCRF